MKQKDKLELGKRLLRMHGRTYSIASFFFPQKTRENVYALYAFVRTLDDKVDEKHEDDAEIKKYFDEKRNEIMAHQSNDDAIMPFITMCKLLHIQEIYPMTFINAMENDLYVIRYDSFSTLEEYMYGSAYVIGIMLGNIMRVPKKYIPNAGLLGNAMQLTNFLRDIGEDLDRGRIYIPQEYLKMFGVSETMLQKRMVNKSFIELYAFLIKKNREMYMEANKGIKSIPSFRSRIAVSLASLLYEKILDKIEAKQYKIFNERVYITTWDKVLSVLYVVVLESFRLPFLFLQRNKYWGIFTDAIHKTIAFICAGFCNQSA